jgi:hypothetical protein
VGLAAADAFQAQLAHQPLEGAASHHDPLPMQLPPDLAGAVDPEVVLVDPAELGLQRGIPDRTR